MNWKPLIQSLLPDGLEVKPSGDDFYYIQLPGQEIPASGFSVAGLDKLPAREMTEKLQEKANPCIATMKKYLEAA